MKFVKITLLLVLGYASTVALFEAWLGYSQPAGQTTLTIITTDIDGVEHQRVLSRLDNDGKIYVSANHWPRRWYKQALARPEITVKLAKATQLVRAAPVEGAEHDRLLQGHNHGLGFRILTGFPPRYFLRLDPN